MQNTTIRNVAIIAHVDHGKTTLVDQMLRQCGQFRQSQVEGDRILDSDDIEDLKAKTDLLMQASMKLGEAMYKASQEEGAADAMGDGPLGSDASEDPDAPKDADDDDATVVDADFEEVDPDKKSE